MVGKFPSFEILFLLLPHSSGCLGFLQGWTWKRRERSRTEKFFIDKYYWKPSLPFWNKPGVYLTCSALAMVEAMLTGHCLVLVVWWLCHLIIKSLEYDRCLGCHSSLTGHFLGFLKPHHTPPHTHTAHPKGIITCCFLDLRSHLSLA